MNVIKHLEDLKESAAGKRRAFTADIENYQRRVNEALKDEETLDIAIKVLKINNE